jgi:hypothetical protein
MERREFLREVIKAGATLAVLGTSAETESEITGTNENLGNNKEVIDNRPTLEQLWSNPGSPASLIVLSLLSFAENKGDADSLANGKIPPYVTYQTRQNTESDSPLKAELVDMQIQDPAHKDDKRRRIPFEMVAHDSDSQNTSQNTFASWQPESRTLIFEFPGFDSKAGDFAAFEATLEDKPDPAEAGIASFMQDVKRQILKQNLPVEHSVMFAHSLGAGPARKALEYLQRDKEFQSFLGGMPKTVFLEERAAGSPDASMADHITSVRHYPSTFTNSKDSQIVGKDAEAIITTGNPVIADEFVYRQEVHTALRTATELWTGGSKVVEATKEQLSYAKAPPTYTSQMLLEGYKLADGTEAQKEELGITTASSAVVLAGALNMLARRRAAVAREKEGIER